MHLNEEEIENLEKIYRINLINSCTGYKAANLIGTVSENNNNLAIFSSLVHLGSNPPLLGFFLRPTEIVPRHTYLNIKENQYYTINSVEKEFADKAHHTSAKYDKSISEFEIAKKMAPPHCADPVLRYNSCVRTIKKENLQPRQEFDELY